MKIETKFNVNDNVYFVDVSEGEIRWVEIVEIEIKIDIFGEEIIYELYDYGRVRVDDEEIFATFEEAENYLKKQEENLWKNSKQE